MNYKFKQTLEISASASRSDLVAMAEACSIQKCGFTFSFDFVVIGGLEHTAKSTVSTDGMDVQFSS